jgi:hypothetical protein
MIHYHSRHDRISTLAALTVSPTRQHMGLYLRWPPRNFQAVDVANFLRALWRHLRGPIILLWDHGSMHRAPAIDAVRQAHPRLHVEEFPAYAPELNPTEQVWNDFKGHTATVCCGTPVISAAACARIPAVSAARKPNCAHASWPLLSLLPRGHSIIAYAKRKNIQE